MDFKTIGTDGAIFLGIVFFFLGVEDWRAYVTIFGLWLIANVLLNVIKL
jgi:hypothetical protein